MSQTAAKKTAKYMIVSCEKWNGACPEAEYFDSEKDMLKELDSKSPSIRLTPYARKDGKWIRYRY